MLPSYPQSKSTTIIPLEGSLDIGKKTTFKQELWAKTPEGVKKVVLDFGKVGFIDSACLGIIIGFSRQLKEKGIDLVIAAPNEEVRSIFQITRLDKIFSIFDSVQEAMSQ